MTPEITVYTTSRCVQCMLTKKLLAAHDQPYREINVEKDPEAAALLKEKGYMKAPVVMTSLGEEWTGFRPDLLEGFIRAAKEADRG